MRRIFYRLSLSYIFNSKKDKYSSTTTFFLKTFNNEEDRPFNHLKEFSDSYGFKHIGKFPLNSFDLSYGLEYSDENYKFSTWDELPDQVDLYTFNQSLISQQTQDRKNYNFFLQVDKSFKNSFLTFGSFLKFLEVFRRLQACSDVFGAVWTCSDTFGPCLLYTSPSPRDRG